MTQFVATVAVHVGPVGQPELDELVARLLRLPRSARAGTMTAVRQLLIKAEDALDVEALRADEEQPPASLADGRSADCP